MYIAFRRVNIQRFLFIVNIISIRFRALFKCTHTHSKQNNDDWERTCTQESTPKCTWLQMDVNKFFEWFEHRINPYLLCMHKQYIYKCVCSWCQNQAEHRLCCTFYFIALQKKWQVEVEKTVEVGTVTAKWQRLQQHQRYWMRPSICHSATGMWEIEHRVFYFN